MDKIAAIRDASRLLIRELKLLDSNVCDSDLSLSDCHLLHELRARGAATVGDLADALLLEKSTVSRLCSSLQRRGLIAAGTPASDKRRKPLQITERGQRRLAEVDAGVNERVANALDHVAEPGHEPMIDGLARYARALSYARRSQAATLREITPEDDPAVARIIRQVMTEHGAVGCGYSIQDPEVDAMHAAYSGPRTVFYVVEYDGEIRGCGGVAPLREGPDDTCELQKMYFLPSLRGLGVGTLLLNRCLSAARTLGFRSCYLETLKSMHNARKLYRKHGFEALDGPLGDTGHSACNHWMAKAL